MKTILGLMLSLCFFFATAQNSLNETLKQQMIADWERAKAYTQEYLNAMPSDKYSFRPTDSVRSFAEQMLHLAHGNVGMASFGTGYKDISVQSIFLNPIFGNSPGAQTKDSVEYYVTISYDFVINAVKNMDSGKLDEVVDQNMPGGLRSATRLSWLLKAFEHQTHHRGQCAVYLRLVGVHPPAEKLW